MTDFQKYDQDRDDAEDFKAQEIEREIEHTRDRLTRDIDEIGERLRPRNLAHNAMDSVTDSARRTGSRFVHFARDNPFPLAAVGLGVTWWMTRRGKSEVSGDQMARYSYTGPERRSERRDRRGLGARIGEAAGHAKDAVSGAASTVTERAGELGSEAKSRVRELGTSTRDRAMENPLAVAVGAALLGLAIGFLLPETSRENRVMGRTRDRLADRASDTIVKVSDAATEVAEDVKETLKSEVAERGPQVKEIAQDVGRHVVDQVKDSAARVKERAKET